MKSSKACGFFELLSFYADHAIACEGISIVYCDILGTSFSNTKEAGHEYVLFIMCNKREVLMSLFLFFVVAFIPPTNWNMLGLGYHISHFDESTNIPIHKCSYSIPHEKEIDTVRVHSWLCISVEVNGHMSP